MALVALHLCHWKFLVPGQGGSAEERITACFCIAAMEKQHSSGLMAKALKERATCNRPVFTKE